MSPDDGRYVYLTDPEEGSGFVRVGPYREGGLRLTISFELNGDIDALLDKDAATAFVEAVLAVAPRPPVWESL